MTRFTARDTVGPGLYFNVRTLSFTSIEDTGPLPGRAGDVYRRVPLVFMLIVGPLLGLAYVVFLPFIGIAMVLWLGGRQAARAGAGLVRAAARVVRPGWEPSMAFFSRRRPAKPARRAHDDWAEDVRKKLDSTDSGEA